MRRTNQRQDEDEDEDEAKSNQIMDNLYIQFPVDFAGFCCCCSAAVPPLLQNGQE